MNLLHNFNILGILYLSVCSCLGYSTWEEFEATYENEEYYPRMFPVGTDYGDAEYYDQTNGVDAGISFSIPFAGKRFKGAYIASRGHVELSTSSPASYSFKELNTEWPNQDYPTEADPPFISPFIADWDFRGHADPARLYWRVLDPSLHTEGSESRRIIENQLAMLALDVHNHIASGYTFTEPTWGLVITWHYVRYGGCVMDEACKRNTVQMALVGNEDQSHVIFNYYSVDWSGGIDQKCDPETGLTGDSLYDQCNPAQEGIELKCDHETGLTGDYPYDQCNPAQVGVNAGWTEGFTALPTSRSDDVITLDEEGATGVQGRYLFRVDGPRAVRGGCSNQTYSDPDAWRLEVEPQAVSLYGGEVLYFSGPCLLPEHNIKCRLGTEKVDGWRLDDGMSVGWCVAPRQWVAGWTKLCVSTDGGASYPAAQCANVHVVPRYWEWTRVDLHDHSYWYSREPENLTLSWNPDHMLYPHQRHDGTMTSQEVQVRVRLLGYSETRTTNGTITPHWYSLHTLADSMDNSGMYSFIPEQHACAVDCDWGHTPPTGLLEVSVQGDPDENPRRIYSEPVPLGWYFNPHYTLQYGPDWPKQLCANFHFDELALGSDWVADLEPCPATHSQAQHDSARIELPPPHCPHETGGTGGGQQPCPLQPRPDPHITCGDGPTPGPHSHGASTSCCYPLPPEGVTGPHGPLLYGLDHTQGSASNRASPLASVANQIVPLLSHMIADRQPYTWCCMWSESREGCTEQYMRVRPVRDGVDYATPQYAVAFGDPHFVTFDGLNYTFNGHGEFWLLEYSTSYWDSFNLQVRMSPPEPSSPFLERCIFYIDGSVNGSLLSAVAMQEGYGDSMHIPKIQIEAAHASSQRRLQVLYNGQEMDMTSPGLHYQQKTYSPEDGHTRRIILTNHDPVHQSQVTVTFDSGVSVKVTDHGGYLSVTVVAPPSFKGHTLGLLGNWNDDPTDDLKSSWGAIIPTDSDLEHIHNEFGKSWEVWMTDSRFTYRGSADWDYHRNEDFRPNFDEPLTLPVNLTEADVEALCGDEFVCRFDYKTTACAALANMSLVTQHATMQTRQQVEPVLSCSYLDVPHSVREVSSYTERGSVTFTACSTGYTLRGTTQYSCVAAEDGTSALWTPQPDVHCKDNDEIRAEKARLATAIAVPLFLILIAFVIAGVILYQRCTRKPSTQSATSTQTGNSNKTASNGSEQPPFNQHPSEVNPAGTGVATPGEDVTDGEGGKKNKKKKKENKTTKGGSTVNANRELQFESMAANAHLSQSLASVNVSYGNMVLSEELHPARPLRPPQGQTSTFTGSGQLGPASNGATLDISVQPQLSGSRTSLNGVRAHGVIMTPQGPHYINMSYDANHTDVGRGYGARNQSHSSLNAAAGQSNLSFSRTTPPIDQQANQLNNSRYGNPPSYTGPNIDQTQSSLGPFNPHFNAYTPDQSYDYLRGDASNSYPDAQYTSPTYESVQSQPHWRGPYTDLQSQHQSGEAAPSQGKLANQTYDVPIDVCVANLAMADESDSGEGSDVTEIEVGAHTSQVSIGGRDTFV